MIAYNKLCTVENCNNSASSRSWCNRHYMLWYRYGEPTFCKRSKKDNKTKVKEYTIWASMKQRCSDKNCRSYSNYGGRGIKVCDRWLDISNGFRNFLEDMGKRPKYMSIDRIDNEGDYEPSNCRWATAQQQSVNKRVYKNNTSGQTGVYRFREQWVASIKRERKHVFLGYFNSKLSAIEARKKAEMQYATK